MSNLAPIVVFCYNRPSHIIQTLKALKANKLASESRLFIYSDGYKSEIDKNNVEKVRQIIESISGFKEVRIIKRDLNWGLAKSVIHGVSEILNRFGKIIVIEDDLITSSFFLTYMNESLTRYENDNNIFSVSGYVPPLSALNEADVFLYPRTSSWGWGTWASSWEMVDWRVSDFDQFIRNKIKIQQFNRGGIDLTPMLLNQKKGVINSWAIRFSFSCFTQNMFCLYPRFSMVKNIGIDGSGTHHRNSNKYDNEIFESEIDFSEQPFENLRLGNSLRIFFKPSIQRQLINILKRQLFLFFNHD